ncbi:hypothetical protein QUC31_013722 [Theobroma cacao]
MTTTDTNTHILVFPYPAQGHMLPLLDLTHHLSLHGLTITILITPKNLPYLSSLLSTHPSTITPLILPFPSHPSIPPGIEHVKDLGHSGNLAMLTSLFKLYDPLLHWFTSHPNPPVAIISDFFLGWTCHLALRLNISRLAFFPSGAFFASIDDYIWNDVERCKPLDEIELCSLPGSHVFKADHLPSLFRLYQKSDPNWEPVKDGKIANTRSWGLLVEDIGMGVRVCEGADAVPDSTELGRVVSESMSDGGRMKERAKGLKDEALGGVTNGGSSAKDLVKLVGELFNLQVR